ncbi:hypothetical protein GJAV_G00160200 [Gymnothorax javanicus]|nr:hypothetical protein GJAV_G00160200 [Gymnothorax javanicus]
MEVEKEIKKMTLGHEIGAGAACLKCKEKCEGFELHFWRKICRNCKCGLEDHDVQLQSAEDRKVGRLFEDTKYTGLMAKLKKDGVPSLRGTMVTLPAAVPVSAIPISRANASSVPASAAHASTVPANAAPASVVSTSATSAVGVPTKDAPASTSPANRMPAKATPPSGSPASIAAISATLAKEDVPLKTATYDWVPPVANQCLVVRYIELLPVEKRPIAGSEGAAYRKKQMAKQLPEHDQDPSKCHELSPSEVKQMEQYVKKYKQDALGMGDLVLPEEMGQLQAQTAGKAVPGAGARDRAGAGVGPGVAASPVGLVEAGPRGAAGDRGMTAAVGALGTPGAPGAQTGKTYACSHCQKPMKEGEPAVYAERAGYDKLWHPACFVCCICAELLVDMIYFWKKGKLYCGRHYGDSEKPRCGGCDELIFCNEYTQAEGQNWHLKHFCCFDCDCVLAGETYVMENEKPVCKPCYMKSHAVCCTACRNPIEPEAQRVSYGEHHWHAEPDCFQCSCCSKCLMGQRFMALQGMLFCSVECKKKTMA